jgi:hypothetical protein
MDLKAAVAKYLEIAGSFGEPAPLDRFGLAPAEIEALLASWEDDYHISRHFELVPFSWMASGIAASTPAYRINGVLYSAIIFRETIRDVVG